MKYKVTKWQIEKENIYRSCYETDFLFLLYHNKHTSCMKKWMSKNTK